MSLRAGDYESSELRGRLGVVAVLFSLLFVMLMGRLFYLQILRGDEFREKARVSFTKRERLPARRGRILERNGMVLADNVARFELQAIPYALRDPLVRATALDRLADVLKMSADEIDGLDGAIVERLSSTIAADAWKPVLVRDTVREMGCKYGAEGPDCARPFSVQVPVFRAHQHELPGFRLRTSFLRSYPERYLASHLLGFVNLVTAEDLESYPGVYKAADRIGRDGAERAMEAVLRGEPGEAEYVKGARDLVSDFRPSVPGLDVWLTIDGRLQREVRQALRYHRSGAAVVLHPRTGEILAMYSTPGFDPNEWSGRLSAERYAQIKDNPYGPMHNKALTAYPPGSVYKIVTAVAALEEGVVTKDTELHCPGYYDYGGRRFHCHNRSGHGAVDLVKALKYSCDVYFYKVGEQLGMDVLARYGAAFGFGLPTGIEMRERVGRVPTKKWHEEETSLGFQPGLTLSVAIGQGSLTASPLQVARAFAAMANGGELIEARIVRQFTDSAGEVVQRFLPISAGRLPGSAEDAAVVREGLVRVVNDASGTGGNSALDMMVVAGKSGTAEAAQTKRGASEEFARWLLADHAWFAAYAPADDPQVVVVVFLEHGGGGGSKAAPVVKRILESWVRLGLYEAPAPAPVPSRDQGEVAP